VVEAASDEAAPDEAAPDEAAPDEAAPDEATLVEAARALAVERYRPGWHSVACALLTRSGQVFTAIHLDATVGRIAVCAEPIAVGMAVAAGDMDLELIVAVRHPRPQDADRSIPVVSPCGMCRETLLDYAPGMDVLMPQSDGLSWVRTPVEALLPSRYTRRIEPVGEHGRPPTAL